MDNKPQEQKHFVIPEDNLLKIIGYLQTKPFGEVDGIIKYLKSLPQAQTEKPKGK